MILPNQRTVQFSDEHGQQRRQRPHRDSPQLATGGERPRSVRGHRGLAGHRPRAAPRRIRTAMPLTRTWTFTWTGDPGTSCTATGTTTLTPILTCTDDALVTARLSVSDGVNPAVVSTASVTIGNGAPSLGHADRSRRRRCRSARRSKSPARSPIPGRTTPTPRPSAGATRRRRPQRSTRPAGPAARPSSSHVRVTRALHSER